MSAVPRTIPTLLSSTPGFSAKRNFSPLLIGHSPPLYGPLAQVELLLHHRISHVTSLTAGEWLAVNGEIGAGRQQGQGMITTTLNVLYTYYSTQTYTSHDTSPSYVQ